MQESHEDWSRTPEELVELMNRRDVLVQGLELKMWVGRTKDPAGGGSFK